MSYFQNYLKAIDEPLPELKGAFDVELKLLKSLVNTKSILLDIGCGVGRPTDKLARFVKKIVAIDNDEQMLLEATSRCMDVDNVEIIKEDALNINFPDNIFDVVYATYNLIGSVNENDRQKLINEMRRVVKVGGLVVNFTWKTDDITTVFLKEYYSSIGIEVIGINNNKTITSKGEFARIPEAELEKYYKSAGLKNVIFNNIGSVWIAVIGKK